MTDQAEVLVTFDHWGRRHSREIRRGPITEKVKSLETRGVAPGGRLESALRRLRRTERRLLLASLVTTNGKRRARLERRLETRTERKGIVL